MCKKNCGTIEEQNGTIFRACLIGLKIFFERYFLEFSMFGCISVWENLLCRKTFYTRGCKTTSFLAILKSFSSRSATSFKERTMIRPPPFKGHRYELNLSHNLYLYDSLVISSALFHSNLSLNTQILALSIKGNFYISQADSGFDYLSDHDLILEYGSLRKDAPLLTN